MVVDAFGAEEDPVQVFSDQARFKISQCETDDYIGCYYGDQQHYIGRVLEKEPFQVQVSFPLFPEPFYNIAFLGSILSKKATKKQNGKKSKRSKDH